MAKSLLLLLLFTLIMATTVANSQSVESESVDLLFPGFKRATADNLTLTGIAEIQPSGILRLTNDSSRKTGHFFTASSVRFKNSSAGKAFSFSTSFAFTIVPEYPKLGGHGFAFVLSAAKELNALPSQYLGLLNASDNTGNTSNHLFAVEFDTVRDFEFGDIDDNHVGVDINSMNSSAAASAAYFDAATSSFTNFSLNGKPVMAWIDYDGDRNILEISVAPLSTKPKIPLLSHPIDLSPIVQEFMYVGFSGSTGLLASSHYILGWSFKTNGRSQALDLTSLPHVPEPKKSHTILAISLSSASFFLLISLAAAATFIYVKIKNRDPIEAWEFELGPHRYSYSELKKATKGFRDKELLGHGGFGRVYRGTLPKSKTVVAVKRVSHESKQGIREFVSEISTIGRLRHRNLAQLMGWCRRRGDLILVYEFMENGSLDKHLFRNEEDEEKEPEKVTVLSWEQRMKIINGVASALFYLHEGFEQVVIHRDVKASNVLLDGEFNGRLGDFGLARLHDHGANMSTTRVVGTLGYLAPELPRTGKATTGSDVFAFGALLLEVVTGRRPIEPKSMPEELILVDWVWERYIEGTLVDVVDKRLGGKFDTDEAAMVARLGLMCSSNWAEARPTMRQVVRYLEKEIPVPQEVRDPFLQAEGRKGRAMGPTGMDGFDDFCHSFPTTSSCEGLSKSNSFGSNNNKLNNRGVILDANFDSLSMSPLSLLRDRN